MFHLQLLQYLTTNPRLLWDASKIQVEKLELIQKPEIFGSSLGTKSWGRASLYGGRVAGGPSAERKEEESASWLPPDNLTCKLVVVKEGQDPKMVPPLSPHHAILSATSGLIFCGWLTQ